MVRDFILAGVCAVRSEQSCRDWEDYVMKKTTLEGLEEALERLEQIDGKYSWGHLLFEVREALSEPDMKECRHCGFLCKPNPDESKPWYPLSDHIPDATKMVAEPVKQEPVAYLCGGYIDNFPTGRYETCEATDYGAFPVYAAPVQPVKQEPVAWMNTNGAVNKLREAGWAMNAAPVDAKAIRAEEQARHNKALKAQMAAAEAVGYIKSKAAALDEPVAFVDLDRLKSGSRAEDCFDHAKYDGLTAVYAAPIGTEHFLKAIAALRDGIVTCRAEALEEAAKWFEIRPGREMFGDECAAAIRGLK